MFFTKNSFILQLNITKITKIFLEYFLEKVLLKHSLTEFSTSTLNPVLKIMKYLEHLAYVEVLKYGISVLFGLLFDLNPLNITLLRSHTFKLFPKKSKPYQSVFFV